MKILNNFFLFTLLVIVALYFLVPMGIIQTRDPEGLFFLIGMSWFVLLFIYLLGFLIKKCLIKFGKDLNIK